MQEDIITQIQCQVVLLSEQYGHNIHSLQQNAPSLGASLLTKKVPVDTEENNGLTPLQYQEQLDDFTSKIVENTRTILQLADGLPCASSDENFFAKVKCFEDESKELDNQVLNELNQAESMIKSLQDVLSTITTQGLSRSNQ